MGATPLRLQAMTLSTLVGGQQTANQEMQMANTTETIVLDFEVEHARWEAELRGLVRALGWKYLKRARRPQKHWESMVSDMEIFSWRAWRSLRLRGLEPQKIGVWAIADRAVRSSLQGARFQPIGTMGDRSWADSIYNKRNNVKVRSNREDWQLTTPTGDGQEDSDLLTDWMAWKDTLDGDDRELIKSLERGDLEAVKTVKNIKKKKRLLADRFREYRSN